MSDKSEGKCEDEGECESERVAKIRGHRTDVKTAGGKMVYIGTWDALQAATSHLSAKGTAVS